MKATLTMTLFLTVALGIPAAAAPRASQTGLDVVQLIAHLHQQPWPGADVIGEGTLQWDFRLTTPMRQVLVLGPKAQPELLRCLDDQTILDQVIFLLGGTGDETAVGPIIDAMQRAATSASDAQRARILTAGNLALTNITAADVIWHRGGGIAVARCPDQPERCWAAWWARNRSTFRAGAIDAHHRNYSNFPNYGIYANMPDSREQAF